MSGFFANGIRDRTDIHGTVGKMSFDIFADNCYKVFVVVLVVGTSIYIGKKFVEHFFHGIFVRGI